MKYIVEVDLKKGVSDIEITVGGRVLASSIYLTENITDKSLIGTVNCVNDLVFQTLWENIGEINDK